jgi:hypothetical protein
MHLKHSLSLLSGIVLGTLLLNGVLTSCKPKKVQKEEQISIHTEASTNDSVLNSIQGNVSITQIPTSPNSVLLTGLPDHRLVTIYKSKKSKDTQPDESYSYSKNSYDYDGNETGHEQHFMPGLDILYGYFLLNIGHYDMKTGKLNFLLNHPALIKTLYYPSFEQDSLNKKPINRNYYLMSVYDEDTNKDTLINRKDLRRFYYFDASGSIKIQLIPADYSVLRSQYDSQNDVMYLFAKQDTNKNGTGDLKEPVHIFWISLKDPTQAKRLY